MLDRRQLIATLGWVAGGVLGSAGKLAGQPTPTPTLTPTPTPTPTIPEGCRPKSNATDLGRLYAAPLSAEDGAEKLQASFLMGLQKRDPNLKIGARVAAHLAAGYMDAYEEKYNAKLFDETNGEPAAQWVLAIDHAFILGQLAAYYRKRDPQTNKLGAVKPRDVVRAQARFIQATSIADCDCFINTLKAYELPAKPSRVFGVLPPVDEPCKSVSKEAKPGQINEPCPLC